MQLSTLRPVAPVRFAASFTEMWDNSLQTAGCRPARVHVQYIIGFCAAAKKLYLRSSSPLEAFGSKK